MKLSFKSLSYSSASTMAVIGKETHPKFSDELRSIRVCLCKGRRVQADSEGTASALGMFVVSLYICKDDCKQ